MAAAWGSASRLDHVTELVPNHHADYPQMRGLFGYLAALTMIVGRGSDSRLVATLAGLGADDAVLDIGCGPGTAARYAATNAASVTGVDPSEPMLRLARLLSRTRSAHRLRWVVGTAESLPVSDDDFTVCWSLASVHHWRDLDAGLREVRRALKPGGRFLAVEKRVKPEAKGLASHGWTDGQSQRFGIMLEERGFQQVEVSNHDLGRRRVVVVQGLNPGMDR